MHSVDPFAIELWQGVGVRWYGLAYLGAFLCTFLSVHAMRKKGLSSLGAQDIVDYVSFGAVGALLGARLGYALFYAPGLFGSFSASFPFWDLLSVHRGGMSSHGGFLGVLLACWIFSRKRGFGLLHLLDISVLGASAGFFFGRLANFVNAELYGRVAEASLWWGVKFPTEILRWDFVNKERLRSLEPAVRAFGLEDAANNWSYWLGDTNFYARVWDIKQQLVDAAARGNVQVLEALVPVLNTRYPSQLVQAACEGLGVFLLLSVLVFYVRPRFCGVVAGTFAWLYAVARIFGEVFRMPDDHIGFDLWGLTRGQWLSFGLVLIGAALYWWAFKKKEAASAL